MPIDVDYLCRTLDPRRTILLFGAGSSIPSGGMTGQQLASILFSEFSLPDDPTLTLADAAAIIEKRRDRRSLVDSISKQLIKLRASGSVLNLPRYDWASIYTTNYDTIIEQAYARRENPLSVFSSNFDFTDRGGSRDQNLFKIHGTLGQDRSTGHQSNMVITGADYDAAAEYRELIFNRLRDQLGTGTAVVIGHSLGDPDLKTLIDEALRLKSKSGAPGKLILFIYTRNDNQALIWESRGFDVCFGGLDEFFAGLEKTAPDRQLVLSISSDPIDVAPSIVPVSIDLSHAVSLEANLEKMFNGRAATYSDIAKGYTFKRTQAPRVEAQLAAGEKRIAYIVGVAGVGKTTMARQVLHGLLARDFQCFEHKTDFNVPFEGWIKVDGELLKRKRSAVLLIDDAHEHLREVNRLVEAICSNPEPALRLLLCSSKAHWSPRLKSPVIFSHGEEHAMSRLDAPEVEALLELLESQQAIARLVESRFLGYSRPERRRRLQDRCSADMFVCLKHIFGFDSIDNIILQEFNELTDDYQEVYRNIAAMETAGVRVHRQLIMRTVGVQAAQIPRLLEDLDGILDEYTVSEVDGIYGWTLRHSVIAEIVARHKFPSIDDFYDLLERVIEKTNPSYRIEIRSLIDMCDRDAGVGRIPEKTRQNVLLRRMISLAPSLNVPRHRLITNLIDLEEFELAESEIRIFEKELGVDGPVHRYKVKLRLGIAQRSKGLTDTDRAAKVMQAAKLADDGVARFSEDKNMHRVYLDCGVDYYRYTGSFDIFNDAMEKAIEAQRRILDPELQRVISRFERLGARMSSPQS